ncbi:hypothetical protein EOD39_7695 [Acipenser ruthenus]|uniref:Uncharacterized protein n=1 Tax=Acipenser ruthenus TaxID=7906 RepID=A0A662YYR1_ACIRT|nr:hypothetical protein EOD39_7695 [Acipenser ruthenus]
MSKSKNRRPQASDATDIDPTEDGMAGLSSAVQVDSPLALHTTKILRSEMAAFSTEFQKFRSENCILYLQASLDSVKDALLPRLHDLEHSVTDIDSRVTTLEATYASMTEKNKALQEKIDYLENPWLRNQRLGRGRGL